MKIAFLGTPEFAVPSLERLVDSGFDILAVVTQPDECDPGLWPAFPISRTSGDLCLRGCQVYREVTDQSTLMVILVPGPDLELMRPLSKTFVGDCGVSAPGTEIKGIEPEGIEKTVAV